MTIAGEKTFVHRPYRTISHRQSLNRPDIHHLGQSQVGGSRPLLRRVPECTVALGSLRQGRHSPVVQHICNPIRVTAAAHQKRRQHSLQNVKTAQAGRPVAEVFQISRLADQAGAPQVPIACRPS